MEGSKKEKGYSDLLENMQDYAPTAEADFLEGVSRSSGQGEDLPMSLSVGARVKATRQEKALSLQDVSQRTGFPESTIAQIESGEILPPPWGFGQIGQGPGDEDGLFAGPGGVQALYRGPQKKS